MDYRGFDLLVSAFVVASLFSVVMTGLLFRLTLTTLLLHARYLGNSAAGKKYRACAGELRGGRHYIQYVQ